MTPIVKEIELSNTFVWSPITKEEDDAQRMGIIYGKLINAYENGGNPEVFDQNKILIAELWEKEKNTVLKNEFLYRIEKILMLYEHWYKTNKWLSPLVAVEEGSKYRVHPGKDRWYIMKHLKIPRYQFVVIEQVNYQTLNLISGFWDDKKLLSIKGKEVPSIFHNYDKTDVYKFARIPAWLNSNMTFKEFAAATVRQRLMAAMINKKGP